MTSPLKSLTLGAFEIHFAYLDSGAPNASSSSYTTIFIIPGIAFTAPVFQKVLDLAPSSSIRIVVINRRDYPGSSKLAPEDIALITGDDEAKHRYLSDRGLEFLAFIDRFSRDEDLPAISEDGRTGGMALLGWSLGNSFTVSALANASKLDSEAKVRLSQRLRALILEDAPAIALGMPMLPGAWSPGFDETIPLSERLPFALLWLTAYFDHGDLSTRDPQILKYALPSSARPPTMYSMHSKLAEIVDASPLTGSDGLHLSNLSAPLTANYKRAVFSQDVRALLPALKVSVIGRGAAHMNGIDAFWKIQDDDEKLGGEPIRLEMIPGTNHFVHWDDPELAIESWKRALV